MSEIFSDMERVKKKAKPSGDSSHIYLPRDWEGDEILAINLDSSREKGEVMDEEKVVYGAYSEEKAKLVIDESEWKVLKVSEEMEPLVKKAKEIIEKVYDKDNLDYANASVELDISDYEVVSHESLTSAAIEIDFDKKDIWT